MKPFLAIFKKELLLFLRNIGLVLFVIYSFTIDIYTAGKGIEVKPKFVTIGYVNHSSGYFANQLLSHFRMPEFRKAVYFESEKALKEAIFKKQILVGLIFDKKHLDVLLDATAASQAEVTMIYITQIVYNNQKFPVNMKIHKLFNQNSNSTWFMSLTELMSIVTMLGLILIAVVFVKEKEAGTWDIMLLMPVNPKIIIISKVFSQVFILMVGIIIGTGIVVFGIFDTPMNGNFWLFLVLSFFFAMSLGGIGLVIAAYSESVMQVAQISMLVMLPLLFLSGAWSPISSMNHFLQQLTILSPVRYYIEGVESIFFRGSSFHDLLPYFVGEMVIGMVLFYVGFRKIGKLF